MALVNPKTKTKAMAAIDRGFEACDRVVAMEGLNQLRDHLRSLRQQLLEKKEVEEERGEINAPPPPSSR